MKSKFAVTPLRALLTLAVSTCFIQQTAWAQVPASTTPAAESTTGDTTAAIEQLRAARAKVKASPEDVNARFQLAEMLRKLGRQGEAAQEFLTVTELDPSLYLAYHQLTLLQADSSQIDDAIERLKKLKEEKPKELMLCVALSELLEKRGNYYQAARQLIDLGYANAVPPKFAPKVNARVHYLLTKAKDAQIRETVSEADDDDLDVVPAPLPESTLKKGIAASKYKESKEMKGVGHVPLLH
jgi:tetratricopeptide (TPR) repeat protein